MVLRVKDTKSRARPRTCQLSRLQSIYSLNNTFKILSRGIISQTVRAWGEEPGKGGPLISWNGGLYTSSVGNCAELNEVTPDDIAIMNALGLTEEQQRSAIGNCVVDSMVRGQFVQMTQQLVKLDGMRSIGGRGPVEITSEGAAPELESSDIHAVLTGRPSPLKVPLPASQSNDTADSHAKEPDAIYFYNQDDDQTGYLSQWSQCLFTDDEGTTYISAEQYMMAAKSKYGLIAREYTGINALFHSNDPKVHLGHVARSKPMSR